MRYKIFIGIKNAFCFKNYKVKNLKILLFLKKPLVTWNILVFNFYCNFFKIWNAIDFKGVSYCKHTQWLHQEPKTVATNFLHPIISMVLSFHGPIQSWISNTAACIVNPSASGSVKSPLTTWLFYGNPKKNSIIPHVNHLALVMQCKLLELKSWVKQTVYKQ